MVSSFEGSGGPTQYLPKVEASRQARAWLRSQLPILIWVTTEAVLVLVFMGRGLAIVISGAGLAISSVAAYWLAASLLPTDQEIAGLVTVKALGDRDLSAL